MSLMSKPPIAVFAHRGASSSALENTMPAFDEARMLGATGVELDIQFTKDNQAVVFHDVLLNRLTNDARPLAELTVKELLTKRLGKHFWQRFTGPRVPLWQEVQAWAIQHAYPINMELKITLLEQEEALRQWLPTVILPEGSHISSFSYELLQIVKTVRPDIAVALIAVKDTNWHELAELGIDALHAHKRYYKPKQLHAARQANIPLRFYGIEGNEDFLRAPDTIVCGWITDYPDRVLQIQTETTR